MSEPSPEIPPSSVYAQPWAIRFGFAVLVGFTLLVGLAFMDSGKRAELESTAETTAVGDMAFLALPDPAKAAAPVATFDGAPLSLVDAKPVEIRDTHTRRVGRDAERGVSIYELAETATAAEKARLGSGRTLLLKTAVNQFVTARPAAP